MIFLWKVHHICYCIWGNAWFVSMEKTSFFDLILWNGFYQFIALFAKFKDVLSWLVIFGKIYTKSSWQEMSLKALRTLWLYWVFQRLFCEITWNWTVFWFHVYYKLFMFLPLDSDMWLLGDYLARYYSLCDIGILAPVFVMVISFGSMSAN